MKHRTKLSPLLAMFALLALNAPARAFDAEDAFRHARFMLSAEGGVGEADTNRIAGSPSLWNLGARVSLLPFGVTGSGRLRGALEIGAEPFFQRYPGQRQNLGALALVARYHFLRWGRFAPWVEGLAGAGGTDLKITNLRSSFTFVVDAGFGISYFLSPRAAAYIGYRFQHISNAELQPPDFGFESNGGVIGVSFFLE